MKLKKTKALDLTQPVYQRIAQDYWGQIPIVSSLPKSERTEDVHFKCMARIKTLAERIAFLAKERFTTPSHVHRAAHYLGMSILYHLFCDDANDGGKAAVVYETLKRSEEVQQSMEQIERVLSAVRGLLEGQELGIISADQVEKHIKGIVDVLPENTRDSARALIEKVRGEMQLPDVGEKKSWGSRGKGRPKGVTS
jgi:hypothetical protein